MASARVARGAARGFLDCCFELARAVEASARLANCVMDSAMAAGRVKAVPARERAAKTSPMPTRDFMPWVVP